MRQQAKERSVRGYSKLNKTELLQRLRASGDQILDLDIDARMANVPFLMPTTYVPPQATPTLSPSNAFEDLIDYLNNVKEIPKSVSPKLKKLQKKIENIYEHMKLFKVEESDSALKEFAKVYTINGVEDFDPLKFLQNARQNITDVLKNNRRMKVKMILRCNMERMGNSGRVIQPAAFYSATEVNLDGTDEKELYDTMVEKILEKIAKFQSMGSCWRFHKVIRLELHTVEYKPLRGETYIPLPEELTVKKAIINMKNNDNKCFLWCVLRALNPRDKDQERLDTKLREKENTLNIKGIEYPVSLKDITKFEKHISITALGHEEKGIYPLRNSNCGDRQNKIILLSIKEGGVKHYCQIKSLSRLLGFQVSNHKEKQRFCMRCLNPFWSQESLSRHQKYCGEHEGVKIELPEKGRMLKFEHLNRLEKVPFIVYADFESFIKPLDTCDPNPEGSYTKQYQEHEPSSFCYFIKCFDDEVYESKLVSYTGEDAAQKFVEMLEKDIRKIIDIPKKGMIFGEEESEQFNNATK